MPPPRKTPKIPGAAQIKDARWVFRELATTYPDAGPELDFTSPLELLVATILSAQCTDRRVNAVTPILFAKYPDAEAYAAARQEEVEEIIRPTGFYRNKATTIVGMGATLAAEFGGVVPRTVEELVTILTSEPVAIIITLGSGSLARIYPPRATPAATCEYS